MRACACARESCRNGELTDSGVDSCCVATQERDSISGPEWRRVLEPRPFLSENCVNRLGYLLWVSATGGKSPASPGQINKQNELFWIKCRTASVEV